MEREWDRESPRLCGDFPFTGELRGEIGERGGGERGERGLRGSEWRSDGLRDRLRE